jgi:hypothetical protein
MVNAATAYINHLLWPACPDTEQYYQCGKQLLRACTDAGELLGGCFCPKGRFYRIGESANATM